MTDKQSPDPSVWMLVDTFQVEQAACLWVGADPAANHFLRPAGEKSEIAAATQMIAGAIIAGDLRADHSSNHMHEIGRYELSLVSRVDLTDWARLKKQYPDFLFDTLSPVQPGASPVDRQPTPESNVRNKGGRPPKYDWDAFIHEIIRIAEDEQLPETRLELTKRMLQWFIDNYDGHPTTHLVSKKIGRIYNAVRPPQ